MTELATTSVNLGPISLGSGKLSYDEVFKANWNWGGSYATANTQTTASLVRGVLANTAIQYTNNNLSHACGFKFNLNFNVDLGLTDLASSITDLTKSYQRGVNDGKKGVADYVRSQMSELITGFRTVINALLSTINLDPSGSVSFIFSQIKAQIRKVNSYLTTASDALYSAGLIVGAAQGIQEIKKWIEQLPSQLKNLVQSCLSNFTSSIKKAVGDVNALPSQIESSVKGQISTFTNGLQASVTSLQAALSTPSSNTSQTIATIISGDSSTEAMDNLKKLLSPTTTNPVAVKAEKP